MGFQGLVGAVEEVEEEGGGGCAVDGLVGGLEGHCLFCCC